MKNYLETIKNATEQIKELKDLNSVFGKPIQLGETTIIPVNRINISISGEGKGKGAGEGAGNESAAKNITGLVKGKGAGSGAGSGAGNINIEIIPVGFLYEKDNVPVFQQISLAE